ncbi:MAG: hypothetical protein ACR2LL_00420 [Nitrosopumilus sp.]
MVILYTVIGSAITVGIILLKYYLDQRKKDSFGEKFCYECNLPAPRGYKVCPRCGLPLGS